MKNPKRKCIFFDRDGIVNVPPEEGGYVCQPEDFVVMPEFLQSLRIVEQAGYDAVIITNQQGVGKGLYTERTLSGIHAKLNAQVEQAGLKLLAIYYCPHLAREECDCRKPKPGMFLKAAEDWAIDLANSWMVGDSFRDVDAGLAAGCRTLLVNPDNYDRSTVWIQTVQEMPPALECIMRGARQHEH